MKNPTNLEFKKIFDGAARDYDKISNHYTRKRRLEYLQISNKKKILEVGAGTGIITEYADETSLCTDISFEMCKQAKKRRKAVVCCDAELLPFKKKYFDVIISSEMIYYLENPERFLRESHLMLNDNGEIRISMVNKQMKFVDDIRKILQKFGIKEMYFDDKVKKYMDLTVLKKYLDEQNFKIISVDKKILIPLEMFDSFNKIFEKTELGRFCLFIIVYAVKKTNNFLQKHNMGKKFV